MRRAPFTATALLTLLMAGLTGSCGEVPTEVGAPEGPVSVKPGVSFVIGQATTGEMIATDKDDYAPGDTVWFTGAGWQAGDTLDILLVDEPLTHEPHEWWVPVDETGGFRDSTYVVDVGDLGVTFTLTATSRATGQSLTVVFTDGNIRIQSNLPEVTFTVTATKYISSGNCTTGAQAPTTQTVGNSPFTFVATPGESYKLVAAGTSDQSPAAAFVNWTTGDPVVSNVGNTICVVGFNGNRNYTANYDAAPDLELAKSAGAFSVGNPGTYTLVVTNAGNTTASGPSGNRITLTDALPAGLTPPANFNEDNFSCTVSGQTVTCQLATGQLITVGATRTIHINVGVTAAACSSVNNSATVSGGNEPAGNVDAGNTGSTSTNIAGCNTGPTAEAGGPYSGDEGSAIVLSGATASGTATPLTYKWTYAAVSGVDAGATCSFSPNDTSLNPSITCTDDGTFEATLTVKDADDLSSNDMATVTVSNVSPVADAGGPYSGNEGSAIALSGSGTDAGANDAITAYHWTVDATGIDAGGTCTLSNANIANPTVTCTDDGVFKVTLTVTDDEGATSTADEATLTVANVSPVANAGGPYSGNEGSAIALSGSGSDAGTNDAITAFHWTVDVTGIDAGGACTFSDADIANPTVTCTDDGVFKVALTVTDDDGATSTADEATLTVANVAPTITSLTLPLAPVPVNTSVSLSATFSDPGSNDTHTASINWEAGANNGTVTESPGSVSGSYTYTAAGIYTVILTVADDDAGFDTETFMYVVVYDPSAGFVTGGGWFNSLPGMYLPDASLSGKANFGFVSKYQKGATVPIGNTEFQFHAASLNFSSTAYEWLVVNGTSKATYKGSGTINGGGNYGFLLSVVDNGSSGDTFRMKIWDRNNADATVYDNQVGAGDNAVATTLIAGGNIVVHTGKK